MTIKKKKNQIPFLGIDFTKSKNLKNKPIISNVAEDGPSFGFLNVNDLILEVEKEKIKTIKNFIVKLKKNKTKSNCND